MIREIELEDTTISYKVHATGYKLTHSEDIAMYGAGWILEDFSIAEGSYILIDDHKFEEGQLPDYVDKAIEKDLDSREMQWEYYTWFENGAKEAEAESRAEAMGWI